MLVYEDGPYAIFDRFRRRVGVPDGGEIRGLIPELLICVWCTSVWTAVLFWLAWEIHWMIPGLFAAAAIAIAMERVARP